MPRSQISGSGHHRRHAPVSVALVNATVPAGRVDGSLHPCPHDRGVHISSARVPSPIRPMLTDSIAARQQCFSWSRTRSHSLRKRFRNNGLIVTNRWRLAPALPSPTEMRTDSRVPERRRIAFLPALRLGSEKVAPGEHASTGVGSLMTSNASTTRVIAACMSVPAGLRAPRSRPRSAACRPDGPTCCAAAPSARVCRPRRRQARPPARRPPRRWLSAFDVDVDVLVHLAVRVVAHSGMFPCFFGGIWVILRSSSRSAVAT